MSEVEMAPQAVKLTRVGLAVCDFAFRDGLAMGLDAEVAYAVAKRLSDKWDGTKSIKELYEAEVAEGVAVLSQRDLGT